MLHGLSTSAAPSRLALAAALALHAAALLALLYYAPARKVLLEVAPIVVNLLAPPKPEPKIEPAPEPPRPKPVAKLPPQVPAPLPLLAAPVEAPTPARVAPPPPEAPPPLAATPSLVPVTPPIFDAAYLDNPAPPYPAISRRAGEQGRVVLRVLVNTQGTADEVQVRTSSGSPRLDDSARATVQRWRFFPARRGTEAVSAWVLVPILFRLEE